MSREISVEVSLRENTYFRAWKRFSNLYAVTFYNEVEHRNGKEIANEYLSDSPDGALYDLLVKWLKTQGFQSCIRGSESRRGCSTERRAQQKLADTF